MSSRGEVNWDALDKSRFFVNGVGVFSGLLGLLYPLTVVKTRLMVGSSHHSGFQGAVSMAQKIVRDNGVPGLYRGLSMVLVGAIPSRMIYLSTLEMARAKSEVGTRMLDLGPASAASLNNFIGGAAASLMAQAVVVPVDVISQRLMLQDGPNKSHSAVDMMKRIVQTEGVGGFYRGFKVSLVTNLPSSALWWGFYGLYTRSIWLAMDDFSRSSAIHASMHASSSSSSSSPPSPLESTKEEIPRSKSTVVAVQAAGGVMAGFTTGFLTNPLDVIKTRYQTAEIGPDGVKPSLRGITEELLRSQGFRGLYRGVGPRMLNTALWATCMVSSYEFLKRVSMKTQQADDVL
eukprot:CAMPEP_0196572728 /NCGR_PEP_ID=MMETSP1081-20130531/2717_1 /TAXON_ID=36882 /ORGANISM="Pyramimonas amylifera, Strain CCMP720" /LENGTH=345 /DNA_ID=CAMNT_0041890141 /DNA_START=45 /DNA_END=1082 /DNA_ORIENTATION=+